MSELPAALSYTARNRIGELRKEHHIESERCRVHKHASTVSRYTLKDAAAAAYSGVPFEPQPSTERSAYPLAPPLTIRPRGGIRTRVTVLADNCTPGLVAAGQQAMAL